MSIVLDDFFFLCSTWFSLLQICSINIFSLFFLVTADTICRVQIHPFAGCPTTAQSGTYWRYSLLKHKKNQILKKDTPKSLVDKFLFLLTQEKEFSCLPSGIHFQLSFCYFRLRISYFCSDGYILDSNSANADWLSFQS